MLEEFRPKNMVSKFKKGPFGGAKVQKTRICVPIGREFHCKMTERNIMKNYSMKFFAMIFYYFCSALKQLNNQK
jgi:hypothetical protein